MLIKRRSALRDRNTRIDQIYEDKLEGKIDEDFWTRKQTEYREQEREMEASLFSLNLAVCSDHVLTLERVSHQLTESRSI